MYRPLDLAGGGSSVLYMQSFNVKEGKLKEFQAWAKKNEDLMAKHAPKGWTYRGTYGYVLGFGRYGAATIWEFGKYGDFDTFREHRDPMWERLGEDFGDFAISNEGESVLLREIGDVKITEKAKIEEERSQKKR